MKGAIRSFRDLEVWQNSMDLVVECYGLTKDSPKWELYGSLSSQIRRAAISIPANVAEGHARPTSVYRNHVGIALGSQAELDTILEVAVRVGYVNAAALRHVLEELSRVGRRLHGLRASLGRTQA